MKEEVMAESITDMRPRQIQHIHAVSAGLAISQIAPVFQAFAIHSLEV